MTEDTHPADRSTLETSLREVIATVLSRAGRDAPVYSRHDALTATGLGSLDLAAVIALMEQRHGVDPFLEQVSVTEMRTVGDLVDAYFKCLAGEAVPSDTDLADALARGKRSRE